MRLAYSVVKIASGTSLSNEINLLNHRLLGFIMPAAWDAAGIAFAATFPVDKSADPVIDANFATAGAYPFQKVVDDTGTEVTLTVAAATYVALTTAMRDKCDALARTKFRSGTAGAPVNQTADRYLLAVLAVREGAN